VVRGWPTSLNQLALDSLPWSSTMSWEFYVSHRLAAAGFDQKRFGKAERPLGVFHLGNGSSRDAGRATSASSPSKASDSPIRFMSDK
jgi:hypothetical protein